MISARTLHLKTCPLFFFSFSFVCAGQDGTLPLLHFFMCIFTLSLLATSHSGASRRESDPLGCKRDEKCPVERRPHSFVFCLPLTFQRLSHGGLAATSSCQSGRECEGEEMPAVQTENHFIAPHRVDIQIPPTVGRQLPSLFDYLGNRKPISVNTASTFFDAMRHFHRSRRVCQGLLSTLARGCVANPGERGTPDAQTLNKDKDSFSCCSERVCK